MARTRARWNFIVEFNSSNYTPGASGMVAASGWQRKEEVDTICQ